MPYLHMQMQIAAVSNWLAFAHRQQLTLKSKQLPEPFKRRCRIASGFHFLLALQVPRFKHVKDKM